jgi:hypothetical protein
LKNNSEIQEHGETQHETLEATNNQITTGTSVNNFYVQGNVVHVSGVNHGGINTSLKPLHLLNSSTSIENSGKQAKIF